MDTVTARLGELPDRAVTPAQCLINGKPIGILLLRRGEEVLAYEDLCPHQYLPLTWRGPRVLSADGTRLRCSNHGAEFAVEDGRSLSGPGHPCPLTRIALQVDADGTVRAGDAAAATAP